MMRKYETNRLTSKLNQSLSFKSKKKSLGHHVSHIYIKDAYDHPKKSPLQFRNNNVLLPLTSKSRHQGNTQLSNKGIDFSQKIEKKDKQNTAKSRKLTKKVYKQENKLTQKQKLNDKVKELEEKFTKMKQFAKHSHKQPQSKSIKSVVTQYQVENLVTKTTPLKFNVKPKKMNVPYYISTLIDAYSCETSPLLKIAKAHLTTSLQLLEFTKKIQKPIIPKSVVRLPKTSRNTLIFDLDQTLVHCNQNINQPHDVLLDIRFPNGQLIKAGINVRPYAIQCLKQLCKYYQLIVFTASHSCYANAVIDYLDPDSSLISHRYFRDSCHHTPQGIYIKDLRVIDRSLSNLLLIDNAAYSYCFQIQNGVPIVPFYSDKNDFELKQLTLYLKQLSESTNLRRDHCNILKTNQFIKYDDPEEIINKLYSEYTS